jgi:hypothetical protein
MVIVVAMVAIVLSTNTGLRTYHTNQVVTEAIIENFYGEKNISGATSKKTADLVKKLFGIPGVSKISLARYEISLQKGEVFEWKEMHPEIMWVLKNHFGAKKP